MPIQLGSSSEFNSDEQAVIAQLVADDIAAGEGADDGTGNGTDDGQQPTTTVDDHQQQATTSTQDTTSSQATRAAASDAAALRNEGGNLNAALRASRHAERAARERAEQLAAEVEALRAQVPSQPDPDTLTPEELAELEADLPLVAKAVRIQQKAAQAVAAAAPAAAANREFTPPTQPDNVQEAIDANPALLGWQHQPDQSTFKFAVNVDALLQAHPAWATKPMAERFAEVVRRVNAELPASRSSSTSSTTTDAAAAAAAIAGSASRKGTMTLSDVAGGAAASTNPATVDFSKLSDEDTLAWLEKNG